MNDSHVVSLASFYDHSRLKVVFTVCATGSAFDILARHSTNGIVQCAPRR